MQKQRSKHMAYHCKHKQYDIEQYITLLVQDLPAFHIRLALFPVAACIDISAQQNGKHEEIDKKDESQPCNANQENHTGHRIIGHHGILCTEKGMIMAHYAHQDIQQYEYGRILQQEKPYIWITVIPTPEISRGQEHESNKCTIVQTDSKRGKHLYPTVLHYCKVRERGCE